MRPADILKQVKGKSFVPFRMHLSDGSHYDVRHPEMIIVSHTVVSVGIYGSSDPTMPEFVVMCDPIHITRLEPIDGKQSASPA